MFWLICLLFDIFNLYEELLYGLLRLLQGMTAIFSDICLTSYHMTDLLIQAPDK